MTNPSPIEMTQHELEDWKAAILTRSSWQGNFDNSVEFANQYIELLRTIKLKPRPKPPPTPPLTHGRISG